MSIKKSLIWDESLTMKERLQALMKELTLEEKMTLCTTGMPEIERLGIPAYSTGGEAAHGVEARHDQSFNKGEPIQTTCFPQPFGMSMMWDPALMEEIGTVVGTEARIHAEIENRKGKPIGGLCRWAPTVDMERDPRWGRTEEGYGEDPFLTGKTASAYIRGMRGTDERYIRCGASLKHFYANNTETDRVSASSSIGLRDKYEYYLEPFRRCIVEGRAEAIMTSYNEINGVPAICDPDVQKILKDTYHLPGHVVCDGGDMVQTVQFHHYFDSHAQTVAAALKAGVDSFTDGAHVVVPAIREALERGLLTEADLDRAISNSFATRIRLGLFDESDRNPYAHPDISKMASKKHAQVALKAAQKSIVLLKNERDFLPYHAKKAEKIAVIGPLANEWYKDWYCGIPPYESTVLDGMRNTYQEDEILYCDGLDRVKIRIGDQYLGVCVEKGEVFLTTQAYASVFIRNDWGDGGITLREEVTGRFLTAVDEIERICLGKTEAYAWFIKEAFHLYSEQGHNYMKSWCGQPLFIRDGLLCAKMRPEDMIVTGGQEDALLSVERTNENVTPVEVFFEVVQNGIESAVAFAKEADRVILCLGSNPVINAKEEIDRKHMRLPMMQEHLLEKISAENRNVLLVIVSNYPYILPKAVERIPAIIFSASGCQEMGNAIAEVISGEVNPAGRLSMTWISDEANLPSMELYDLMEGKRTYRYHEGEILYPFGYGLSYATFRYDDIYVETDGKKLKVRISVMNTSKCDGDEVIQLYYRKEDSLVKRPRKQLIGFERVHICAGKTEEIEIEVPYEELMYYDVIENRMLLEDGGYLLMAGGSSEDLPLEYKIQISGERRMERMLHEWYPADHYDEQRGTYLYQGYEAEVSVFAREISEDYAEYTDSQYVPELMYQNCRYEGERAKCYELVLQRVTKDVRTGERKYASEYEERVALTDAEVIEAIQNGQSFLMKVSVTGTDGIKAFRIVPLYE